MTVSYTYLVLCLRQGHLLRQVEHANKYFSAATQTSHDSVIGAGDRRVEAQSPLTADARTGQCKAHGGVLAGSVRRETVAWGRAVRIGPLGTGAGLWERGDGVEALRCIAIHLSLP